MYFSFTSASLDPEFWELRTCLTKKKKKEWDPSLRVGL